MSLALAAKHLESQGRNKDSKLVHMTPEELRALNKLSLDHVGKPLSTNPKTGLPEAGFLSSILPTVAGIAGAAMGIPLPLLAGGVGLLSYAMTGDIGQGIMAGLGAWSGGTLGAEISKVGAATAQTAAGQGGTAAFEAAKNYVNPALVTNAAGTGLSTSFAPGVGALANTSIGPGASIGNFTNAYAAPGAGLSGTGFKAMDVIQQPTAQSAQGVADAISKGAQSQAAPWYTSEGFKANTSQFGKGFGKITESPTAAWNFVKENPYTVAGAALPLVSGLVTPAEYKPFSKEEENPFGFKKLSKDFKGSFPTQPDPYYTAQYPDYRARPYGMKDGGLSDIDRYKSKGKVDVEKQLRSIETMNKGIELISPSPDGFAPIVPRDPGNAMGGAGIMQYEQEYADMTPDQRAYAMMKNIRKRTLKDDLASGLQPMGALGALDFTPAAKRQEMLEAQAKQQIAQEAKRGGLMDSHLGDYSDGGRLLKGPGDGVSDSIPATIGGKQAARLAEGEFVIPARIVSELGNGSTDAGAKRLYAMMDRIKAKRRKAKDIAADTKSYKLLPA
jgi:hypothetical protein